MSLCAKILFPGRLQMISNDLSPSCHFHNDKWRCHLVCDVKNEIDQIGERERGLWVVTIKVATAYCVCSGKLPSLHTLATYTQVKCPSTNKEIFILWMVFFSLCKKSTKQPHCFRISNQRWIECVV